MTGIGRSLNFNHLSNRAIFFLTVAAAGCGIGYQMIWGQGGIHAVLQGLGAGLAVFLAWALGRELDPDHDPSALLASGFSFASFFIWGVPGLLILFWLLMAVRMINRTTGLAPTILDSLVFLGIGLWMSYQGNWMVGLLTPIVFLLESLLPQGKKLQFFFAALAAVLSGAALIWNKELGMGMNLSWEVLGIALFTGGVLLPVIDESRSMESKMDKTDKGLFPVRVQAGQVLAGLFWILTGFGKGINGLLSVLPVGAAILGMGLFWLFRTMKSC